MESVAWGRCGFGLVAGLVLLLATAPALGQSPEAETDHPFRFGFSTGLIPDVNENDYRAAMRVWAETVIRDGVVRADPNVLFCRDLAAIVAALQSRSVDGVAATTTDFFAIQQQVKFNHCVFGVTAGSIADEYVLLVHRDSGLTQIEQLQGRSLNVQRQPQMCLALIWLDTLLLEQGRKPAVGFCSPITEEGKLTKTVLPVFFRRTDACLVTRKGFKTMSELNPQVGRQLRVLATSPEFVGTGFFLRTGYPAAQQAKCLGEFTRVHTTAAGQQILTVFQTERLEEHPVSVLDSAFALMERHRQLVSEMNRPKTVAAGGTPNETKGGGL
jgi:ABC-type phosphate/phosphonate transport system substrate-binding protein